MNFGGGRTSESVSLRRQRVLGPEAVRALPAGPALVLATGCTAAMVRLIAWYVGPRAGQVPTAVEQAEHSWLAARSTSTRGSMTTDAATSRLTGTLSP